MQNSLAAVAVGLMMGLDFDTIASTLAGFAGVHRRFERLGSWHEATVVDDYAHHPTEVAATLAAAREAFPQCVDPRGIPTASVLAYPRPGGGVRPGSLLGADRVLVDRHLSLRGSNRSKASAAELVIDGGAA